jgi:diguanylate cyclase (GGDEF)-like protein
MLNSIKSISVVYVTAIVLVIAVTASLVLTQVNAFTHDNEIEKLSVALNHKTRALARVVKFYQEIVEKIAAKEETVNLVEFGSEEDMSKWSLGKRRELPDVIGLALFTLDGRVRGGPAEQFMVGPACVLDMQSIIEGRRAATPPLHSLGEPLAHIDLIANIKSNGENTGLLFLSVSFDVVQQTLADITDVNEFIILATTDGQLLTEHGKPQGDKRVIRQIMEVPGTGWQMEVARKEPTMGRIYLTFGVGAIVAAAGVGTLIVFMTLFYLRSLGRGFATIQTLINDVLEGRRPEKQQYTMLREIGDLMPSFESLASRIHVTQRTLEQLTLTDELTDLVNRRGFIPQLDKAIALARREIQICLCLIDIDYFKRINDAYGHEVGDRVLLLFADTLRRNIRQGDVAARLGGDEFGLLLYNMSHGDAADWFERFRQDYRTTMDDADMADDVPRTLSAGVLCLDGDRVAGTTHALRQADKALYKAKAQGRDQVTIIPADNRE